MAGRRDPIHIIEARPRRDIDGRFIRHLVAGVYVHCRCVFWLSEADVLGRTVLVEVAGSDEDVFCVVAA